MKASYLMFSRDSGRVCRGTIYRLTDMKLTGIFFIGASEAGKRRIYPYYCANISKHKFKIDKEGKIVIKKGGVEDGNTNEEVSGRNP